MTAAWARMQGVTKTYGKGATLVRALRDVHLDIHAGELMMIQGPSGSGKTTLLQVLGLLLRADRGDIVIQGRRMAALPERRLPAERRREVGFIFQGFNLLDALNVRDNVAVGAWLNNGGGSSAATVDRCLQRVGLGNRAGHLPPQLSGGEKQRTAVARAFACPGRLILADEPTANLDWPNACHVMQYLVELAHEQGKAVVFVAHDLRLRRFADRIVQLADGRIVGDEHNDSDDQVLRQQTNEPSVEPPATAAGTPAGPAGPGDRSAPAVEPQWRGEGGSHAGRWALVLTVAAVAAAGAWFFGMAPWGGSDASAPVVDGASDVAVGGAADRSFGNVVAAAPAVVEPSSKLIALGSERPGRVKAVLKEAGEPVAEGEALVKMDDSTARAVVELRRADLGIAEANLAKLKAWDREEERAQAKARRDRAQATLERARREFERIKRLYDEGQASENEYNETLEDLHIAEADLAAFAEAYRMSQAGPTREQLLIAEAEVAQAKAALHLAEAELGLLTVRSPVDGHVIYRHMEPGEIVNTEAPMPIVSVGRIDQIRLRAEVDEADIGRVHVGQVVIATADVLEDARLRGRVVHMEPIMGRKTIRTQRATERKDTKVREVLIALEPDHPPLPIDLRMTVRFLADGHGSP